MATATKTHQIIKAIVSRIFITMVHLEPRRRLAAVAASVAVPLFYGKRNPRPRAGTDAAATAHLGVPFRQLRATL